MAAAVIGFSKIPSGVDSTTAFVPFSISNSLRIRRGITTWPFVVNDTVSARSVALIRIYATKDTEVSQRIVCRNSDLLTHLILVDRQIRLVAHARAGSRGVAVDPGGFHPFPHVRRASVDDEGVCDCSKSEFMIFLFSGHRELVAKAKTANPSGRRFAT